MEDKEHGNQAEAEASRERFLRGNDFMKLGQAINHGNWQIAMMTAQRMQGQVRSLGLSTFESQLMGIKQCIIHKQQKQAKDILALMSAKRVQLLKQGREN